ncbi:MAG: alginate export family protein [Candidatus Solibacter usitatus]|nr:alginate export family protein [Candidatus Solibacter usitatus]
MRQTLLLAVTLCAGCALLPAWAEGGEQGQAAPASKPAQAPAAAAKPAAAAPAAFKPIKWGNVVVSGSLRTRLEMWDWFAGNANNDYAFSGNLFRLSFAQTLKKVDWQLELAAPVLLGLPKDAIAPAPQSQFGLGGNYYAANKNSQNAAMLFPKQGYVRFKGLFGDKDQSVRLGRFEWMDGGEAMPKDPTLAALKRDRVNQRLIGPFPWTHVGRSFDGGHYTSNKGRINYTLVGALPTRGAFQVDGWGNLKVGFVYGSVTGQTGGGKSAGEWRALAIYYQDWRHVLKTDNRPAAVRQLDMNSIRIGTYGGHYIHKVDTAAGTMNVMLWGVLQSGKWGRQDHAAGAIDLEAGWQPKALPKLKPWLSGGYFHSSGDGDTQDNKHNTFFQLLPTPRLYARTPFYNMMNNEDIFGMLTVRPHKAVTLRSEFHALRLANRKDLWYLGGGAFQPWSFGYVGRNTSGARSLANLWDVSADWNVNAHFAFTGYLGYVDGRAAVQTIYPKGTNGKFGYLELTYKF